jgi:hypothetical protein
LIALDFPVQGIFELGFLIPNNIKPQIVNDFAITRILC